MAKDTRVRVWTFLVYPDSAPENWRQILMDEHIAFAVSPLHDRDIDSFGLPKKPHWHVILTFEGKKSFDQIMEYCNMINAPIPKRVESQRMLVRYFAHIDDPDKAQYNLTDTETYGLDLAELLRPSGVERTRIIREVIQYIKDYNITEYCNLIDDLEDHGYDEWLDIVLNYATYSVEKYIKSNRDRYYAQLKRDREQN